MLHICTSGGDHTKLVLVPPQIQMRRGKMNMDYKQTQKRKKQFNSLYILCIILSLATATKNRQHQLHRYTKLSRFPGGNNGDVTQYIVLISNQEMNNVRKSKTQLRTCGPAGSCHKNFTLSVYTLANCTVFPSCQFFILQSPKPYSVAAVLRLACSVYVTPLCITFSRKF